MRRSPNFQTALKLDPKSVPALDGLTKALIDQKRLHRGNLPPEECTPQTEALQLNLAIAYSKSGDQAGAVQNAIADGKGKSIVRARPFEPGNRVYPAEPIREAAEEFQEALRLDSTDDIARASLIKVLVILVGFQYRAALIQEICTAEAA